MTPWLARTMVATSVVAGGVILLPSAAYAALAATVTPSTGLHDGDTVTVAWTGTTPGSTMNVIQCSGDSGEYCDTARGQLSIPNPTGEGSVQFVVHTGVIGIGQCGGDHPECSLFVNQDLSFDEDKNAFPVITFATDQAPSTTTTLAALTTTTTGAVAAVSAGQTAQLPATGAPRSTTREAVIAILMIAGGEVLRRWVKRSLIARNGVRASS